MICPLKSLYNSLGLNDNSCIWSQGIIYKSKYFRNSLKNIRHFDAEKENRNFRRCAISFWIATSQLQCILENRQLLAGPCSQVVPYTPTIHPYPQKGWIPHGTPQ